jgi:hypothetical protein
VRGCLPCKCGSYRLIPDVFMGNPTVIAIRCIDCDASGKREDTQKGAILMWNRSITGSYIPND